MYKKEGVPEEGEIVICTVKKITPHAAFVELDEYGKEAMLHISEVASKWVRRIKDYIDVGNKIVCKVISVKGDMIDVSLRRVSQGERKRKLSDWKIENRLYQLINALSNAKRKTTTEKIIEKIVKEYGSLKDFFEEYKENKEVINELDIPKTWKTKISKAFDELIKSSMVEIKKEINLYSLDSNGIEKIKELLKGIKDYSNEKGVKINITYIAAPRYLIKFESKDYKTGEKFFNELMQKMKEDSKKFNVILTA